MKRFKALSVKQPWANLICAGTKTIETRRWQTNIRGPLLICASKAVDIQGLYWLEKQGHKFGAPNGMARGVALCLVDLLGCTRTYDCSILELDKLSAKACCDVTPFMWAWHLDNVRRIRKPYPEVKGQLGLFHVELDKVWFDDAT